MNGTSPLTPGQGEGGNPLQLGEIVHGKHTLKQLEVWRCLQYLVVVLI